ncbi:RagB/SusD family nutrient uptake outer membrane protein [Pedobacter aquatilis]|uniref:RagB/SusD family nutrient uptake outer membrane protein n=1 Tax=Pedobacter aquatilis TaxID=351343 RepID=UPI00292F81DA|nr:RagB/SusD family nutrient uptake outer membrane protein [Pedobacter aquatilis]
MKIRYILILLCFLNLSCQKILDKDPQNQLSLEETFSTFAGTKSAMLGAYNSLFETSYYNGLRMAYPEVKGGNTKYSQRSLNHLLAEYDLTSTAVASEMNATYATIYQVLNNLNNVLKYTPALPDATTAQKNRLLAEAKTIRALAHFDLLQLYAQPYTFTTDASHLGIVLALEPIVANKSEIKRSTVAVGYQAVLADLKEAITLFASSERVFTSGNKANYATSEMAEALLARAYLNMGSWQNAYTSAGKLIDGKSFTLFTNGNYVNAWTLKNTSESIFEIAPPTNFSGNSYGNYFDVVNGGNYLQYAATDDLLNLYSSTDIRRKDNFYKTKVTAGVTYYYTAKYPTSSIYATGIKVLRISEMYLIRAEAAAELGLLAQANADLNIIRQRADLMAPTPALASKDALIQAILLERRKELNYEGFLLFDLARRKQNIVRNDCQSLECGLNYPSARYILPIPEASVISNPLMIQNPEY